MLAKIRERNMRRYTSLRYPDPLFAYCEYIGDDYEGDTAMIAADATTQKWWAVCGPMRYPLADRAAGVWWKTIEALFHID